jgi:hypothetical protein
MKKIIYILLLFAVFTSCEDFLDTESYTKQNTANFPANVADAEKMLTGIYSAFNRAMNSVSTTHFYVAELASDDRFGGGGETDYLMQAIDRLKNYGQSAFSAFWTARYEGISRANTALATMDNCEGWNSEAQKKQFEGEVRFLRAIFYFELAQIFGEVPLVVNTEAVNLPKSPAENIFALIAYDLQKAIELMYDEPYTSVASGHATKWAAEALMARAFLFYTGYYGKDALPLSDEGGEVVGSISKSQITGWLEDCINNSGHDLVSDFRNLWPINNAITAPNYPASTGLWEGNGNKEAVFAVKFGATQLHTDYFGYSNQYDLYFSPRSPNGTAGTFPYGQGWGAGPVNTKLWTEWDSSDPRRDASIAYLPGEYGASYNWGADDQMEETGYWQKKYVAVTAYNGDGVLQYSYAILSDGAMANFMIAHTQELVLIRFADVLLMHSELAQTADGINRVRGRVGLSDVTYSLDNLKKERRWELAFEGVRYFDLMRWGDAADVLDMQANVTIKNKNVDAAMKSGYSARYNATGGFWPIPDVEIALSAGVLKQNKGWGTSDAEFTIW